ncbi:MAG: hypothetical protein HKP14_01505 [Bacteroidia bacterium]|nr:hypothetical protein [Bacteroidia bacterium]
MKIRPQEKKLIVVNANDKFGGYPILHVQKGEKYNFTVNPLNRWKYGYFSSSTLGIWFSFWKRNLKRNRRARYMELCGTIGKSIGDSDFRIGTNLNEYVVPTNGPLYFFPNIGLEEHERCSGNVVVKVQRIQ